MLLNVIDVVLEQLVISDTLALVFQDILTIEEVDVIQVVVHDEAVFRLQFQVLAFLIYHFETFSQHVVVPENLIVALDLG